MLATTAADLGRAPLAWQLAAAGMATVLLVLEMVQAIQDLLVQTVQAPPPTGKAKVATSASRHEPRPAA